MGWAIVVGCTKRQFQIVSLLEVSFKLEFLKINILQVVMFQNVFMDPKILKEKQIILFFSMSFGIFVSFQNKFLNLCFFPISYKCKYVISFEYVKIISRN
jgi:hypothetical protein